jgi:hypothetical protein
MYLPSDDPHTDSQNRFAAKDPAQKDMKGYKDLIQVNN